MRNTEPGRRSVEPGGPAGWNRVEDIYPLSPVQEGILFHILDDGRPSAYLGQFTCVFRGALDPIAFEKAWQRAVDLHQVLRTSVMWEGLRRPLQVVSRHVPIHIEVLDWRDAGNATDEKKRLDEFLLRQRRRALDLSRTPLISLSLARLASDRWRFVWCYPQILLDGWSTAIILKEVFEDLESEEMQARARPTPYRDYIAWLRGRDRTADEAFWREALDGFESPTRLRVSSSRIASEAELPAGIEQLLLSLPHTERLRSAASACGVTLSTLLHAAWALILGSYSGEGEVVFGSVAAARPEVVRGADRMVGHLLNTLPVRVGITRNQTVREWLRALQQHLLSAREHGHVALREIQAASGVPRRTVLFETLLAYENYSGGIWHSSERLVRALEVLEPDFMEDTGFPLMLLAIPLPALLLKVSYDPGLFRKDTIVRMLVQLRHLLDSLTLDPGRRLEAVPRLPASDSALSYATETVGTSRRSGRASPIDAFERHVREQGEAIAGVFPESGQSPGEGIRVTYGELNDRANRIGHYLRGLGVGPEARVGMLVERSFDMVAVLLGILKAGGAYVPLDAEAPWRRTRNLLEDSGAEVVVTHRGLLGEGRAKGLRVVALDDEAVGIEAQPCTDLEIEARSENLAYVLYTSGTTGKPKGVEVTHRGLTNLLEAAREEFGCKGGERFLAVSSLTFDIASMEVLLPLVSGGSLVLVPERLRREAEWLRDSIGAYGVTMMQATPSTWRMLLSSGWEGRKGLGMISGGEVLGEDLAAGLLARGERLWNGYGPTENTIYSTFERVGEHPEVTIGRPVAGTSVVVLDPSLEPVPIGVPGQLHLSGEGLARGYHSQPGLTAETFIPDPYGAEPGRRLYATGDLVRLREDGRLEFLGRIDNQVKVRGFRIELEEIEATLRTHAGLEDAAVVRQELAPDRALIQACVVPHPRTASAVRRLAALKGRSRLTEDSILSLPDGTEILYRERNETLRAYREIFVDQAYCDSEHELHDRSVVVDVGAGIGLFSVFVRSRIPDARIHAYGRVDDDLDLLQLNAEIHGFTADSLGPDSFRDDGAGSLERILAGNAGGVDLLRLDLDRVDGATMTSITPRGWSQIRNVSVRTTEGTEALFRLQASLRSNGFRTRVRSSGREGAVVVGVRDQKPAAVQKARESWTPPETSIWRGARHLIGDLKEFLAARLPDHMIPASFTLTEALPLSPSGKVDRKEVQKRIVANHPAETGPVGERSARTEPERALCTLIAELLGIPEVDIYDNFFELGGDSILSIQLAARARTLGLELTSRDVFEQPSVAELARVARREVKIQSGAENATGPAPLTPIQHWFFDQELVAPQHWNQAVVVELAERTSEAGLNGAMTAVQRHHDSLRLRFHREGASWVQNIVPAEEARFAGIHRVDLSALNDRMRVQAWARILSEASSSLDLERGPVMRCVLLDGEAGAKRQLMIVIHHLAVDGLSWGILLEDLVRSYEQLSAGEPVRLPGKTCSFQFWSKELEKWVGSEVLEREKGYWLSLDERCVGVPARLCSPPATRAAGLEGEVRNLDVELDQTETRALLDWATTAHHATVEELLVAAFVSAIVRTIGGTAALLALEHHGRDAVDGLDVSRTTGWFTSLFPVAVDVADAEDIAATVRAVRERLREVPGGGAGFGILRYLGDEETRLAMARLPVPRISFNYLGRIGDELGGSGTIRWRRAPSGPLRDSGQKRAFDLDVELSVFSARLRIDIIASHGFLSARQLEALLAGFVETVRGMAKSPAPSLGARPAEARFPLVGLDDRTLSNLIRRYPDLEDLYPLTPSQQGILFHVLYEPGSTVFLNEFRWTFRGNLDPVALRLAWENAVSRHTALRTCFEYENVARPVQIVRRKVELAWDELDFTGSENVNEQLQALSAASLRRGLDVRTAPLVRFALVRIADDEHRFIWSLHHLILDGWSIDVLLGEVFQTYWEIVGRSPNRSISEAPPYRKYVEWLGRQNAEEAESAWRRTLSGFRRPTPMPLAKHLPSAPSESGKDYAFQVDLLGLRLSGRLRALAKRQGLTLNTLFQGAWALLLHHHSGERDLVTGVAISGRPASLPGVEAMVGLFVNTIAMRVQVDPDVTLVPWLRALQHNQVDLQKHEHCSLAEIQRWSEVPRGTPLTETALVFQNVPRRKDPRPAVSELWIEDEEAFVRNNFALTLRVVPDEDIGLHFLYQTILYSESAIRILSGQLTRVIEAFAERPTERILTLAAAIGSPEQEIRSKSEDLKLRMLRQRLNLQRQPDQLPE